MATTTILPYESSAMKLPIIRNDTTALREDIQPLIEPLTKLYGPRPHFSDDELVLLAAIAMRRPVFHVTQLKSWILVNYKLHIGAASQEVAVADEANGDHSAGSGLELAHEVIGYIDTALKNYEVPIYLCDDTFRLQVEGPALSRRRCYISSSRYAVDARAARIFLKKYLAPEQHSPFDLLGLPTELRTMIYEYALSCPCVRLMTSTPDSVSMVQKELALVTGKEDRPLYGEEVVTPRRLDQVLALVHVSKRIYREALPVFYSVNTFDCSTYGGVPHLVHMLRKSDPTLAVNRPALCSNESYRIECLSKLRLSYSPHGGWASAEMVSPVKYLLEQGHLRSLIVDVTGVTQFLKDQRKPGKTPFSHGERYQVHELPGIALLVELLHKVGTYGLVEREGDSNIQDYLDNEVRRLSEEKR